jgi:hypothetical protein
VLDALPLGIALTLLAALPSFFNFATDQIFEEQKSLLLRPGADRPSRRVGMLSVARSAPVRAADRLSLAALPIVLAIAT